VGDSLTQAMVLPGTTVLLKTGEGHTIGSYSVPEFRKYSTISIEGNYHTSVHHGKFDTEDAVAAKEADY